MIDDVKQRRHRGQLAIEPQQQSDQPEVANGGIGKQAFEIVFKERGISAKHECREAGEGHQIEPQLRTR